MHRAKGDRLVCASMLPVYDNGKNTNFLCLILLSFFLLFLLLCVLVCFIVSSSWCHEFVCDYMIVIFRGHFLLNSVHSIGLILEF